MPLPDDVVWGTATSAAQIEGAVTAHGRTPSIWDTFAARPGTVVGGDTPERGIDHVDRVAEDVELLAGLGVDAYRFSISWSRLLPGGDGDPSAAGVAFYRDLAQRLRDVGIQPFATLYHWDLPQVLADRGGWRSPDSTAWFRRYATTALAELGDLVTSWSTHNEPWCAAFLGHASGVHAPGERDPGAALVVAHRLLESHHDAVAAMRAMGDTTTEVGIVLNLVPAWPASDDPADVAAASAVDLVQNELFLDGVVDGTVPDGVRALHERFGVAEEVDVDRLRDLHTTPDLLGMNYYNVNRIRHVAGGELPEWPGADDAQVIQPDPPLTTMGWGIEPEGLGWMLRRVRDRAPDLALMVMENGIALAEQPDIRGVVQDDDRIDYLRRHIEVADEAVADGVNLRGWFVWSLFDNFEWALGYEQTFGIVHVDRTTMARTPKASYHWYADHIQTHRTT